ncbi:hypothetical protein [Streptomyces tauricus]|uniref:hypothetical protein n=1 Tax=Streptomyces tauricus TaxID=68274 RepID=UPI002242DC17|nr:hypothetical protein [Streptomyces tauricus]MCW8103536.1 hypothetical protein [Streptomyces tauricus]
MDINNPSSSQPRERLTPVTAHAVDTVTALMRTAGPGKHKITTTALPGNAEPITTAVTSFEVFGEGPDAFWRGIYAEAASVVGVLALAFVVAAGSVVLNTAAPTGEKSVQGWMIDGHALRPLTADQIRRAYREPLGTEPDDLTYRTAFPVPSSVPAQP